MHVLVTGFNGFVGGHLVKALADAGCQVSGLTQGGDIPEASAALLVDSLICDLADPTEVSALNLSKYDGIINLAGLADVGKSFDNPELYMRVNVGVLKNLCNTLIENGLSPRVIAISSGAVYASDQPMPLTEKSRLAEATSPYTSSKAEMEKVAVEYRTKGLPECIVVRPFNHVGPGQKGGFLVPDMFDRIIAALAGDGVLKTGNLTTRRDYTDVRDVVRAYTALVLADADKLAEPIYNVCSGTSRSGEEVLAEFKKNIPGADRLRAELDPAFTRPNDPLELFGSNAVLHEATGWAPTIPFETTIADFVASKQA